MDRKPVTAQEAGDEDDAAHAHEYASRDEAAAAIAALTDSDFERLMVLAAIHWNQRKLRDLMRPEELLSEAIVRTITTAQRRRRWRKAVVTLIEHLDRSMESISGHAVGDAVAEAAVLEAVRGEEIDPRTAEPLRFHRAVAEEQLLAREKLADIEAAFAGAPPAFAFFRLKADGFTQSEIMKHLGIDKRDYEAARKKAERVIAQYALQSEREIER